MSNLNESNKKKFSKDAFALFNLDKLSKRDLKTADQIQQHTVDGYLESRSIDRAVHLLLNGDEMQILNIIENIPNLLKEDIMGCLQRVIPRLHQVLLYGCTEYHMSACSSVQSIAQQKIISPEQFTKAFLQNIITSIDSKDTVAGEAWLSTLVKIIDIVPSKILETQVLPIFIKKTENSRPVKVRLTSCKGLGRLATILPNQIAIKSVLPVIISLCQDASAEIRSSICRELPKTGKFLSSDNSNLIGCLIVLSKDEENSVREATIQTVSQILQFIPEPILKSTIIPLIKNMFEKSIHNEDPNITEVARTIGLYCFNLKDYLFDGDKVWFLSRYIYLSQLSINTRRKTDKFAFVESTEEEIIINRLERCRQQCAYNFPAMVVFASNLGQQLTLLETVLKKFSCDPFYLVRKSIASGIHELIKLQSKWLPLLKDVFIKFLQRENEMVIEGLIPNVREILSTLKGHCSGLFGSEKIDCWKEITQALLDCEQMLLKSLNWRLHCDFIYQLNNLPKQFPYEYINQYFVPFLSERIINTRSVPSRMASVKVFLIIMIDESQIRQREKLKNKILELCNSSDFYSRITFVRAMSILLELSVKIFKTFFFLDLINMTGDKVPNIRLETCKMIPKLKAISLDPFDRKSLAAVEYSIEKLKFEKDKDVLDQIKIMKVALDALENMKIEGLKKDLLDTGMVVSPERKVTLPKNTDRGKGPPAKLPQSNQPATTNKKNPLNRRKTDS
uniref:Condensin complex subunit 1 C-terminal domain-containing protein n=1 Tax=Clastoptera arizonana TaxID=38151 RepID=A0A1B6CZF6_9HEMI